MTFNALAQSLVDYKYIDNDVEIMSWTTRKLEILKVVRDSRCDIICLQEIDEADYHDFFVAEFKALGYSVIYKKKLQNRLDGIAVLYRPSRFKLLVQRDVEFSSEHGQYDKPQVALVVALEDVNSDVYIVSNTHLLFNKNRGDIKAYQLLMLLNVINEFKAELRERNPIVLMCGDFNITPQSLLYSFLDEGVAVLKNSNPKRISGQYLMFDETYLTSSAGHSDAGSTVGSFKHYADDVYGNVKNAKLPREDEEEEETEQEMEWYIELRNKHSQLFKGDGVVLTATEASTDETDPEHSILLSPLVLKSAYNRDADVEDMKAEPAYTAYHGWQRGCVDYIWYDPQQLVVEAIYEMPLYKRVRAGGNLPNKHWPSSDHFSLISQFKRG
ncbi:hypothetical protein BEWA_028880 [Theileria equi strain WA]|uniref:Endonuclease/exonuclease/phosphatase domain-containing protein n=1 Tax=Theileria equi strain WA TaxID=1537102 RepID=L0AXR0_THEEQ|nr:hypothetical protein BEWA_028880 [Theileria equi strain WA]AFZ80038.1 hypothetical protein BEWA_028880 [Theileria equi strain WA]|eukprot:XP_004829704.1 hypothetical protein BEWA_028880 [Theileria equi strain WA]